ncbi:hypothetical protein D4764_20G0009040 [Takifugu flavidus]|uniref:Uncharacterized protein n=1 Tax=Takifugu flavidus TaxID=433684 RepID=A0A5C6NH13_9TELE|nr:hypothetical protein D4764_20G0009040 [Takifugu flavidus]
MEPPPPPSWQGKEEALTYRGHKRLGRERGEEREERRGEERRGEERGEERRGEERRGEERRGEETMTQWGDRGLSGDHVSGPWQPWPITA